MWALLLPLLQAGLAHANPSHWPGTGNEFMAVCDSPNLDGKIVRWNGHDYKYHCRRVGPWSASDPHYSMFRPSDCAAECSKRDDCTGFLWLYQGAYCNLGVDRRAVITETPSSSEYLYMERLGGSGALPDDQHDASQPVDIPAPADCNCEEKCQQTVPECQAAETQCKENTKQCQAAVASHQEAQQQCETSKEACDNVKLYCEGLEVDARRVKELYDQDLEAHRKTITELQQNLSEMRVKYNACARDMDATLAICPDNSNKAVLEKGRKFKLACGKWLGSAAQYGAAPVNFANSLQECLERCGLNSACHLATYDTTQRLCYQSSSKVEPTTSANIAQSAWEIA
ncbi:hypothetical protein BJX62DRAFT_243837 [Aspergillus germanicus]